MNQTTTTWLAGLLATTLLLSTAPGQDKPRPYRLTSVDLKQRVIWGAEALGPNGTGLRFGGQDQDASDGAGGRPHTRVLVDGEWRVIDQEFRDRVRFRAGHQWTVNRLKRLKSLLAQARSTYFDGHVTDGKPDVHAFSIDPDRRNVVVDLEDFIEASAKTKELDIDAYTRGQFAFAVQHMSTARDLLKLHKETVTRRFLIDALKAQIHLELAAEALDAEPAARALNCGPPRRRDDNTPPAQSLVYDKTTNLYVLFGGDHLDYLTNDTWVFDPKQKRWFQRHPNGAPPPRANHRLEPIGDGKLRLTGGYTYSSNTDYVGGQYVDLNDGEWVYDIKANTWTGGKLVPADSRTYRTGPFHPDYYLRGDRPDAAKFQAWLAKLPANQWVATDPPYKPRLNRDWGTARIDPSRDIMLRWSGGHSAHGGTDVPHYHFATNRWQLTFPVEFPLGQLYSNTSYPNGFNFNGRPWMTGHTYQNYAFDPPSKMMVKAGRPRHFYIYDPDKGNWVGRGKKPDAMCYNSCFYTLTLTATPQGALCWDKNGRVHLYQHEQKRWVEIETTGDKLPGARVDNSSIVYDSKRDRVLIINKAYGRNAKYDGQVYALDMKSKKVTALSPKGMEHAHRFATIDKGCYDAANDLWLIATYLRDGGERTPTPAYDCANNRWVTLDLGYVMGKRVGRPWRKFPHQRSAGVMFDPRRNLVWGTDTNSQVYVLRIDPTKAKPQPLE